MAVFLCGAALAGCNAVEDTSGSAVYPNPATTVAINGTVSGLSTARPVVLQVVTKTPDQGNTSTPGNVTTTRSLSVRGTNVLRFGAVAVGSTYTITVTGQPYARNCTIANGTGVANAEVSNVTVTCVATNVPRYTLSVSINGTLAANLPAGFAVKLTTEEGTETIAPVANQTVVPFTLPILYPGGSNPPAFAYTVTATNTVGGTTNSCNLTNGTGSLIVAPAAPASPNITNPIVNSCLYTVTANVQYSPTPGCANSGGQPGTPCNPAIALQVIPVNTPINGSGVVLAIKSQITAADIAGAPVTATLFTTTPVTVTSSVPSNTTALYQLYVKTQPTGQTCIVQGGGMVNLVNSLANVALGVRCRNVPALANQLKGVYQLDPSPINLTTGAAVATPLIQVRNFLTFFTDGTFLYGSHVATVPGATGNNSGVEHGFYNYDAVAGTLQFTIITDSNGVTANNLDNGLSGRLGYGASPFTGGSITAQNVVKTAGAIGVPGHLSMRFGQLTPAPVVAPVLLNYRPTLTFSEPRQTLGQITGAWTSPDNLRVFVYDDYTLYGFHTGVNGAPNLQDACFAILNPASVSSFYTRRGGGTGCMGTATGAVPYTNGVTNIAIQDLPDAAAASTATNTTAPFVPGFIGRLPGSQSTLVTATSPTNYDITVGSPDTLVIQNTLNAHPIDPPVVLKRTTTY